MDENGKAPLRRGRLRLDLPLNAALQDLCSLLASESDVPELSQSKQLTSQLSKTRFPSMRTKSSMQRSESLPGSWSKNTSESMRKSSRENRRRIKNHASQLLEAYTCRGRNGSGTFHDTVRSKYTMFRNGRDSSMQVPGIGAIGKGALTLQDGVEFPADRIPSKRSVPSGDRRARSPVGQANNVDDGELAPVETKKEEKIDKVSEAMLARNLNMPFNILKEACEIFRKYSDWQYGMDIGQAKLDMNEFVKVICDLCSVPSANDLPPDFVDETFRTADRDCSGYIDVEEFCVWHASASFSEEMVLNSKDRQIRDISRKVNMPLIDIERFWMAFCRFDSDGSGNIEYDEFKNVLQVLMKVPAGHELPPERVHGLWRQADSDGSGEINFEEFVLFYIQRFDFDPNESEFDFSNFYKMRG
eukprot:TRINITY_DN4235_c0_g1_i1.p1 TRINITY_DN4235_c0_g1~~TRINITY_DN4235_c0_g1_i1.p1  ORF type:complete len:416 (-),score=81.55 TRINITY_DN4235_c0_g1_i1:66-1313(-)